MTTELQQAEGYIRKLGQKSEIPSLLAIALRGMIEVSTELQEQNRQLRERLDAQEKEISRLREQRAVRFNPVDILDNPSPHYPVPLSDDWKVGAMVPTQY